MDFSTYQSLANRTSKFKGEQRPDRLLCACLGLAGETGEFVDLVKKILFHGHPQDTTTLAKELGDILWYIAETASALGLSLDDLATANIEKLKKRYPEGFSTDKSIHREE